MIKHTDCLSSLLLAPAPFLCLENSHIFNHDLYIDSQLYEIKWHFLIGSKAQLLTNNKVKLLVSDHMDHVWVTNSERELENIEGETGDNVTREPSSRHPAL